MDKPQIFTERPKARIEIIPLIDVIFFLLATFVLFTMAMEQIRSIPVPLPKGGELRDDLLMIQASEQGTFYWKESRTAEAETIFADEIRPRLEDYKRRVAAPRVLVRGDRQAKFGATVMLLDEVRLAGIPQVCVETLVSPSGR